MVHLSALLAVLVGVGLVYGVWKQRLPLLRGQLAGWGLLVVGGVLGVVAWGAEYGVVYLFLFLAVSAWLFVVWEADGFEPKARAARSPTEVLAVRPVAGQVFTFLFLFLVGGLASLLVSLLISRAFDSVFVNRVTFAILLFPILWGTAMYWALAQPKLARPTLLSLGLIAGFSEFVL